MGRRYAAYRMGRRAGKLAATKSKKAIRDTSLKAFLKSHLIATQSVCSCSAARISVAKISGP